MQGNDEPGARRNAWRALAQRIGLGAEHALATVRDRFDARFRPDRPVHVIPYRGHANATRTTLSCRVLRYRQAPDNDPATLWGALAASYRRFETDELPGATVRLQLGDTTTELASDAEGYARFDVPTPPGDGDLQGTLSLPDQPDAEPVSVGVTRPSPKARLGVISDLDDTVLVTEATSLLRMMRLTLLSSSASRVAFDGVAAFYRALARGGNPVFYVSSSPWNLYEFLSDFLATRQLPTGPLFLRDFGLTETQLVAGPHDEHKLAALAEIIERHPELPFVLIGDSGQHDPEIYRRTAEAYPGRIRAIYIRDVSDAPRDAEVGAHVAALEALGVPMLLVPDTFAAATHAAALGVIDQAALDEIRQDVRADKAPHPAVDEQPLDTDAAPDPETR